MYTIHLCGPALWTLSPPLSRFFFFSLLALFRLSELSGVLKTCRCRCSLFRERGEVESSEDACSNCHVFSSCTDHAILTGLSVRLSLLRHEASFVMGLRCAASRHLNLCDLFSCCDWIVFQLQYLPLHSLSHFMCPSLLIDVRAYSEIRANGVSMPLLGQSSHLRAPLYCGGPIRRPGCRPALAPCVCHRALHHVGLWQRGACTLKLSSEQGLLKVQVQTSHSICRASLCSDSMVTDVMKGFSRMRLTFSGLFAPFLWELLWLPAEACATTQSA